MIFPEWVLQRDPPTDISNEDEKTGDIIILALFLKCDLRSDK
jgi:hypothetical protein